MFYGVGSNDAIRGLMNEYASALTSVGHVGRNDRGRRGRVASGRGLGRARKCRFVVTWVGIGQDMTVAQRRSGNVVNMWDHINIPLLKLHGDIPAYFSRRHGDIPSTAVNFTTPRNSPTFAVDWMPEARTLAAVLPPLPLSPLERGGVDASLRRKGKLVFLKNGNSPEALRRIVERDGFRCSFARLVCSLADEITPVATETRAALHRRFHRRLPDVNGIDPHIDARHCAVPLRADG